MRVFITGASGHIGSAVVPELAAAGHEVVGLARSDDSAAKIEAAGAEAVRGDLDDLDGLREAAREADGVIHLAFKHESMMTGDYVTALESDMAAIRALGDSLAGSDKPFVGTSGSLLLAASGVSGRPGTERDTAEGGRADAENLVISYADAGVRSSVVRLAPIVHSTLDKHGFAPILIETARRTGFSGYLGDGANRWPALHTLDAARLYRLALESAPAGSRLHGVESVGIPFADIAGAIGRGLDVPVQSVADDDAAGHFGFLAGLVAIDNPTSNEITRELLGWEPTHPGLLADLAEGHYFAPVLTS
ncbi:MAG TPA: SDR family oxidoreductase [Solirubrobacteraceae bacterium]|nr:SDR family oxidoreductase [Solirubrobacteraceae bacterium]